MDSQIAPPYEQHCYWMRQAVSLAQLAGDAGEVPVGAIVVDDNGKAISQAQNYRERHHDPTAHAEVVALRLAGQYLHSWHLNNCTLYVTLEPCPMCAGAIIQARIKLLVYGADDPKSGAVRTVGNIPDSDCSYHRLEVLGGILESNCRQQLQAWFAQKRKCK